MSVRVADIHVGLVVAIGPTAFNATSGEGPRERRSSASMYGF